MKKTYTVYAEYIELDSYGTFDSLDKAESELDNIIQLNSDIPADLFFIADNHGEVY